MATNIQISPEDEAVRLLSLDQVSELVQLSRSCIYRDVSESKFPRPIKLGSSSRWVALEIHKWVREKMEERDGGAKPRVRDSDDII